MNPGHFTNGLFANKNCIGGLFANGHFANICIVGLFANGLFVNIRRIGLFANNLANSTD